MRVAIKVLLAAAGLLVLAAVAIAIAIAAIDVNTFAGPIAQRVKAVTGRDFAARTLALKPSLTPRVIFDDVTLGNAPWAKAPQLLAAKQLELQVALLPLLQRRVEVLRVVLVEPVIALETDGKGHGNWEFGRGATGASVVVPGTDGGSALAALGIDDLAVARGHLTYRDGAGGNTVAIAIESLAMTASDRSAPIGIDFRGAVGTVPVALKGTLPAPEAWRQGRGPYAVKLAGEVAGSKAEITTRVAVVDGGYRLDELDLAYGPNRVTGQLAAYTSGARPRVQFALTAATLSSADLPALPLPAAAVATAPRPAPAARSAYVFGSEVVSFAALRAIDADGEFTIGQLALAGGRRLDRVHARFTLRDGRLDAPAVAASAYGGTTVSRVVVDAAHEQHTAITLRLEAKGLDLAALLAAAAVRREVHGGKTDITLDVSMRGASPRQWVSSLNGSATVTVGPASLGNARVDAPPPLERLAELLNPFRTIDATTELECAAARLPLKDGVARFERGIGVQTKKVGVLASGTLDFRNETLDLALKPKVRAGVPIDFVQFADLVRLRGTFAAPAVTVDAVGSAAAIARVGAAVATSGLSIVGESLVKGLAGGNGQECSIALGRADPATSAAPSRGDDKAAAANPATNPIGRTLNRLLGR